MTMGKRVVSALYKSLLQTVREVKQNVDSHTTVFSAIRNGSILSYDDLIAQRQRELEYQQEIEKLHPRHDSQFYQSASGPLRIRKLVRPYFDAPLASKDNDKALSRRIDKGFKKLRQLNEYLALIDDFSQRGVFEIRRRTADMKFCVGEVVVAKGVGVGVICGWKRVNLLRDSTVKQDVLYDVVVAGEITSRRRHLRRFREEELVARFDAEEGSKTELPSELHFSPWVLTCFDGFSPSLRRFRPSFALHKRYPEDFAAFETFRKQLQAQAPELPTLTGLDHVDDDKLVQFYLPSEDSLVSQCALSVLMGRWKTECGPEALEECRMAEAVMKKDKNPKLAQQMLLKVTKEFPEYAYALSKLGTVTFEMHARELESEVSMHESSGAAAAAAAESRLLAAKSRVVEAMEYYEQALGHKPFMLEALFGLGSCAVKLGQWAVAHDAATRILYLQPDNETAKIILEKAVTETLKL